ncbi:SPASM domain-containing protein [candidate division CSSED10-310 bacterium]|uniref:SPASM domain-containing protein n=1 Tax=candidate division CSSED10-310 bacterium TaxID=2855610 RepID=A0ABV6Z2I4_UNCC1
MATLRAKFNLLRGIVSGSKAFTGPFNATIDLTRKCNLNCPGCYRHSRDLKNIKWRGDMKINEMPFPLYQSACSQLHEMGTTAIILLGEGEPFLHERLTDMIVFARNLGLFVSVVTNGTYLDEKSAQMLVASGLDALQVTLWAHSKQNYEQQYPNTSPDMFNQVVNGLKALSDMKGKMKSPVPEVKLHHPINKKNFMGLEKMVSLARETGCEVISFSPFINWEGQLTSLSLSAAEENQVIETLKKMKNNLKNQLMKHNIDTTLQRYQIGEAVRANCPCYIGWFHTRIRVDGNVFPCAACDFLAGNLKETSLENIWNGEMMKKFRRNLLLNDEQLDADCDCSFCCHITENVRVHSFYRILIPLLKKRPDHV